MAAVKADSDTTFHRLSSGGAAPAKRHVALVPGEDVPLLALDLPERLKGQAREQVARRQVLDQTGLAPGNIEIRPFHAPGGGDTWTRAFVADADRLEHWRKATGPACRAVLPDYLALPTAPGLWTIAPEGDRVLVRMGPEDGFSGEADLAARLLAQALAQGDVKPKAVYAPAALPDTLSALFTTREIPVVAEPDELKKLRLEPAALLAHGETDFDLRRDPQAARNQLRRRVLPWRLPVFIVLIGAGLWAAAQVTATRKLETETARLRTGIEGTVREHFVPAGPILDVRAQVARALAQKRTEVAAWQKQFSPLDLMGQAAGVIAAEGAQPYQILFTEVEGLGLSVHVADFAAVDRLLAAMQQAGLTVELVSSRVGDGAKGVRADLRLGPGGEAGNE